MISERSANSHPNNWSDLQTELLELILSRLSFISMLSFKEVCSSWHTTAKNYLSSPKSQSSPHFVQKPLFMLPSDQDSVCFFSLEHKRLGRLRIVPKELFGSHCIGSSHGWLLLLDQNKHPYLLNLFSPSRIQLPQKEARYAQSEVINKAVLSSNPSHNKDCKVIVTYDHQQRLAYFKSGDSVWTDLEVEHEFYSDIVCYDHKLFALCRCGSVEIWDFNGSYPVKTMHIRPDCCVEIVKEPSNEDLFTRRLYLVEASRALLVVVRYIGKSVGVDDVPVYEEHAQPLVCPYKTLLFRVCKLELDQNKWVEVESLSDCALFLGGNHSVTLSAHEFPECKKNSIYFTDDYWDRMNENSLYGGHDMGVFNLEDKSIEPFFHSDIQRIESPPFWVVPNP